MIYIKPGTFLDSYMQYMGESECPKVYDLITGCWVLSQVLDRDVIVDRPRAPVFLNMYVILVSESGIMRKSTSISMAKSLLRSFIQSQSQDWKQSSSRIIENKVSQKELTGALHRATEITGSSSIAVVASELAAAFGRGHGVNNMVAFLTDLYDCPDHRDAAPDAYSKIPYSFSRVYIGLLAGSTPNWLERVVTPTVVEGGFTSRCYFVIGRQRKRIVAWPENERRSMEDLLAQLKEIKDESHAYSRIGITSGAKRTFAEWYAKRPLHKDSYRESFESREDAHILRFAGLFAANESAWLISDDHLRRAIDFVRVIKAFGSELFTRGSVNSIDMIWIKRVRDSILAQPNGISRMDLSRISNSKGLRTNELQTLISIMHDLDLIQVFEERYEGATGRPRTIYKPTIYLQNEAFLAEIVSKLGIETDVSQETLQ